MRTIRALCVAPAVYEWLANSCHPRILHVFHNTCNLINERREILSIVPLDIGNGPFNIVLEDRILFSETLQIESPVFIFGDQLKIGTLNISTTGATCWSPRPDWEGFYRCREKMARQLAVLLNVNTIKAQSPYPLISELSSALARGDIPASRTIAAKLAGLGIGLTPAGDDFIMGALYATWMTHPPEVAESLAMEVAGVAAPLTTSLSAAWLKAAGKGQAGILWHEFLSALLSSEQVQLQAAIDRLMSVGDTSGTEGLAGFTVTIHSYREITK